MIFSRKRPVESTPKGHLRWEIKQITCAEVAQGLAIDTTSAFGRLLQAAALRNPETGQYCDAEPFVEMSQREQARAEHKNALDDWLSLNIENQLADLEGYLRIQSSEQRRFVLKWLDAGGYSALLPSRTSSPARDLFLSDMNIVILLHGKTGHASGTVKGIQPRLAHDQC